MTYAEKGRRIAAIIGDPGAAKRIARNMMLADRRGRQPALTRLAHIVAEAMGEMDEKAITRLAKDRYQEKARATTETKPHTHERSYYIMTASNDYRHLLAHHEGPLYCGEDERFEFVVGERGNLDLAAFRCRGAGDGVPVDVWHGRVLELPVYGPVLHVENLREDLAPGGKISKLLDGIIENHEVITDLNGNRLCRSSEELTDLLWEWEREVARAYADDRWTVWDAGDYLLGGSSSPEEVLDSLGLSDASTEEDVSQAARALEQEMTAERSVLSPSSDSFESVLLGLIKEVEDDNDDDDQ